MTREILNRLNCNNESVMDDKEFAEIRNIAIRATAEADEHKCPSDTRENYKLADALTKIKLTTYILENQRIK